MATRKTRVYALEITTCDVDTYTYTSVDTFAVGNKKKRLDAARLRFEEQREDARKMSRSARYEGYSWCGRLYYADLAPGEAIEVAPAGDEPTVSLCNHNAVEMDVYKFANDGVDVDEDEDDE